MESDSAFRQSRSKDGKFLGLKREGPSLKENYLFRRLITGNVSGRYEKLADTFFNMMAFDWEEEKIAKLRSNVSKKKDFLKILSSGKCQCHGHLVLCLLGVLPLRI
jgi:hypothetical protein